MTKKVDMHGKSNWPTKKEYGYGNHTRKIDFVKENPYELEEHQKEGFLVRAKNIVTIDADTIRVHPNEYQGIQNIQELQNNRDNYFLNQSIYLHEQYISAVLDPEAEIFENRFGDEVQRKQVATPLVDVRFSNLDADEVGKGLTDELGNIKYASHEEGQPLGVPATEFVRDLIGHEEITLDVRTTKGGESALGYFGRVVATVYVKYQGEWINVNRTLLRSGLAEFDTYGESNISPLHLQEWEKDYAKGRGQKKQAIENFGEEEFYRGYEENLTDDRETFLNGYNPETDLRIGDVKFGVPPTNIQVTTINDHNPADVLRNQTNLEGASGHRQRQITINLYLDGLDDINGKEVSRRQLIDLSEKNDEFYCQLKNENGDTYYPNAYYINGLRSLLAQFKVAPFLPINNFMLNSEHDISAVSLQNITIQNVNGATNANYLGGAQDLNNNQAITNSYMGNFPKCLKVTLTLMEFNHVPYLNTTMPFENAIDWPLFRFNYQRLIKGTGMGHKGTQVPQIRSLNTSDFHFEVPELADVEAKNDAIMALSQMPQDPDPKLGDTEHDRIIHDYEAFETARKQKEYYDEIDFQFIDPNDINSNNEYVYFDKSQIEHDGLSIDDYRSQSKRYSDIMDITRNSKVSNIKHISKGILFYPITKKGTETIEKPKRSGVMTHYIPVQTLTISKDNSYVLPIRHKRIYNLIEQYDNAEDIIITPLKDETLNPFSEKEKENRFAIVRLDQNQFDFIYQQIEQLHKREQEVRKKGEDAFQDIHNNNIEKETWTFPDLILRDIGVSQSNQTIPVRLKSQIAPTQQYLGSNDVIVSMSMISYDPAQVRLLNEMIDHVKFLQNRYGELMSFPMLDLNNDIVNLFDLDGVGIQDMQISNIPGIPNGREITLTLQGFKLDGELNAELEKVGSQEYEDDWATKEDIDSLFQIKEELKKKNLYPDLELPKYKELPIEAKIKRHRDYKDEHYVDPDFYIRYNQKFFKEHLRDIINKDCEMNFKVKSSNQEIIDLNVDIGETNVQIVNIENKQEDGEEDTENQSNFLNVELNNIGSLNDLDYIKASPKNDSFSLREYREGKPLELEVEFKNINQVRKDLSFYGESLNLPGNYYRVSDTTNIIEGIGDLFTNDQTVSYNGWNNFSSLINSFSSPYKVLGSLKEKLTSWTTPLIKLRWYPQINSNYTMSEQHGDIIYLNRLLSKNLTKLKEPEESSYIYTRYNCTNDTYTQNESPKNFERVLANNKFNADFIGPLQVPHSLVGMGWNREELKHNPVYGLKTQVFEITKRYNDLINKIPNFIYPLSLIQDKGILTSNPEGSVISVRANEDEVQRFRRLFSRNVEIIWIIAILEHMQSFIDTNPNREIMLRGYDIEKVFDDEKHITEMKKVLNFVLNNDDIRLGEKTNIQEQEVLNLLKTIQKLGNNEEDSEYLKLKGGFQDLSLEERFEKTYTDVLEYNKRGRLVRAFPSYYLMLIDEGGEHWWWKAKDNFYDYNGISSIDVVKDRKNVADTCLIEMMDGRGLLSGIDEKYRRRNYNLTFGEVMGTFFPWNKKQDIMEAQEKDLTTGVALQAGARLHLRVGYGSSPAELPVMFNGRITELQINNGHITVVGQSDGIELSDPVSATPNERTSGSNWGRWWIFGSDFQQPEEIIKNTLENHDGFFRNIWSSSIHKLSGGRLYRPQDRTVEFLGNVERPDYWNNSYFGNRYPNEEIGELMQNIHPASWDECDLDHLKLSVRIHGMSAWDIIQANTMAVPNYIASLHPFDFRNTIFYGAPLHTVSYGYKQDDHGNVTEKIKTFRQTHFYNCVDSIIDNNIVVSEHDLKTAVQPIAYKGADRQQGEDDLQQVFLDRNIYPSYQKIANIDTSININGRPILDRSRSGEATTYRVARASLKEYVKNMYGGKIVVTGDPTVKPYDYVNLDDVSSQIFGTVEVEKVVHTLNKSTGFLTTITPDPITIQNEGVLHDLNYSMYNLAIKKQAGLYVANTLFNLMFAGIVKLLSASEIAYTPTALAAKKITSAAKTYLGPKAKWIANLTGIGLSKTPIGSQGIADYGAGYGLKQLEILGVKGKSKISNTKLGNWMMKKLSGATGFVTTKYAALPLKIKFLITYLAFQVIDYMIIEKFRQAGRDSRINRNAVIIMPLKKNGRELTAGIEGHQGALISDDPDKWDGIWNSTIMDFFLGESRDQKLEIRDAARKFVTQQQQESFNMLTDNHTMSAQDSDLILSQQQEEAIKEGIIYAGLDEIKDIKDRNKWISEAQKINFNPVLFKNIRIHPQLKNLLEQLQDDRHINFELDVRNNTNRFSCASDEVNTMEKLYKSRLGVRIYYQNNRERDAILTSGYVRGSGLRGFRDGGMAVDDENNFIHLDIAPKGRWQIGDTPKFEAPYNWRG